MEDNNMVSRTYYRKYIRADGTEARYPYTVTYPVKGTGSGNRKPLLDDEKKQEIIDYLQTHSKKETREHFNISDRMMLRNGIF